MKAFQSLPRAPEADHQMVAGIHRPHVNFLVWKDNDDAIFNIDGHLLVGVYGTRCECLDLLKKRFTTPGGGSLGSMWIATRLPSCRTNILHLFGRHSGPRAGDVSQERPVVHTDKFTVS